MVKGKSSTNVNSIHTYKEEETYRKTTVSSRQNKRQNSRATTGKTAALSIIHQNYIKDQNRFFVLSKKEGKNCILSSGGRSSGEEKQRPTHTKTKLWWEGGDTKRRKEKRRRAKRRQSVFSQQTDQR